jgi:hypothetical protein
MMSTAVGTLGDWPSEQDIYRMCLTKDAKYAYVGDLGTLGWPIRPGLAPGGLTLSEGPTHDRRGAHTPFSLLLTGKRGRISELLHRRSMTAQRLLAAGRWSQ